MKQFCRVLNLRKSKNDNIDAIQRAEYGLMYCKELQEYNVDAESFRVVNELNRSYQHYMDSRINQINFIDQTISQTFPGIKKRLLLRSPFCFIYRKLNCKEVLFRPLVNRETLFP